MKVIDSSGEKLSSLRMWTTERELKSEAEPWEFYPGWVGIIIPARDEAEQIGLTLDYLLDQTKLPLKIIVVVNNCTDDGATAAKARSFPAVEVIEMEHNPFLKAGALNAGVRRILESQKLPEFLLTMDADTTPDPDFLENATNVMWNRPEVGVVSAVCDGKKGLGNNWHEKALAVLQRLEYSRAGFTRIRRNIHTMSGAGGLIRMQAALDVIESRGELFAERTDNLVEDFETTLEIKRMGWKCVNNYYCHVSTDLMVTIPSLMKQRVRWVHGTINELRARGWQQKECRLSILTVIYAFATMALFYLWIFLVVFHFMYGSPVLTDFWFLGLVMVYQAITVQRAGWKMMVLSALIIPDLILGFIRHAWIITSLVKSYAPRPVKESNQQAELSW